MQRVEKPIAIGSRQFWVIDMLDQKDRAICEEGPQMHRADPLDLCVRGIGFASRFAQGLGHRRG
jgi:hypothetical protein